MFITGLFLTLFCGFMSTVYICSKLSVKIAVEIDTVTEPNTYYYIVFFYMQVVGYYTYQYGTDEFIKFLAVGVASFGYIMTIYSIIIGVQCWFPLMFDKLKNRRDMK